MNSKHFSRLLIAVFCIAFIIPGCIPQKQFAELKTKQQKCEDENKALKSENSDLTNKNSEMNTRLSDLEKKTKALEADSTSTGNVLRKLVNNYDKLGKTYEDLIARTKQLEEGNANDNKKLVGKLQTTQESLLKREDDLKALQSKLNEKETNLDKLNMDLSLAQKELQVREARVKELEGVLSRKDSAVNALKNKVAEALLGFQNNGLTVKLKNGKVYVSLEEQLLFASGSWEVDIKGQDALKKLAKVLETQEGINVLIEGHTDIVPYKGTGMVKDNWDLSVMRATAIVKIITSNSKINPKQLTAAGRGEYFPIDPANTPEAKKKNRRTEIIITPKLDELLKVLESN